MTTLAEGKSNLLSIIQSENKDSDMNEAQTRFHKIDRVLFDCLGWGKTNVEVENCEQRKFTDYELGKPRLAVLEAKREGRIFSIAASEPKKLKYDLKTLMLFSKELDEAIRQAQDYCSQRGVPIAIVSNGHQLIAFLASRLDGVSIFDGDAVVFKSLEHLHENFETAWQLLSSHGVKEKNIYSYLLSGESSLPNKLSSRLKSYPSIRYHSEIDSTLRQLSELFLQDIIESREVEATFFSECYCESGAISKYALLSRNILAARYASIFSGEDDNIQPHIVPVKEKKNDNFSPDILTEAVSRRPIILLGDVGVGKTSFVKNLIYNSAYEEFQKAIYIYIDLGSTAALTANLKTYVLNEIEKQLDEKYSIDVGAYDFIKGVYASAVHKFPKGIWGTKKESNPDLYETKLIEMLESLTSEKDQHLKRCINNYAKSTQRQIIISLDNADQRDFELQQDAFIISQELAKDWNSTVFLAVRPRTFFRSKRSGALAAYPHKVFTISPPRIDAVIEKRLLFALKMAEGKVPLENFNFVKVNVASLAQFIKALLSSLSQNTDLHEFLQNITGGNIRAAIEFVTSFIGSPNVDAQKIIDIMNNDGRYFIPLHEFTKSALLGDYSHYNPDTSIAMNLFDISSPNTNEYFLTSILLAYLDNSGRHLDNDGFCLSEVLFKELQNYGFTADQIEYSIRISTNKKIIETSQRITFEEDINGQLIGEMPGSFRITSVGSYHLSRWLGVFTYFDAMVFDTPIISKEIREKLATNLNSFAIEDRLTRATAFRDYLSQSWNELAHKPNYFNFLESIDMGKNTFQSVGRAVDFNNQKHNVIK